MKDEEVLRTIKYLAEEDRYILTLHAKERLVQRHLTDAELKDILLNPIRIVRRDAGPNGVVKYKIQGGTNNRKVAVVIEHNLIVITVM